MSSSDMPPPQDAIPINPFERKPREDLTHDERQMAMFCHFSALLGLLVALMTFLGPMIFWLIKKDSSSFVDYHGKESLNFHLNILLYSIISLILVPCFFIGLPLIFAVHLFSIVATIIGGVKANEGEYFRYPLVLFRPLK